MNLIKSLRNKTYVEKTGVSGIVVDIASRSCIFLLQVNSPFRTMCSVCEFLSQPGVEVTLIQLKVENVRDSTLIIQLKISHNIIKPLTEGISKITGVQQIEWIEK